MSSSLWLDSYGSDLQGVYAPIAVPALFLLFRLLRGRRGDGLLPAAAGFIDAYAIAVCLETMVDLLATGPLLRGLGLADTAVGTAITITFVLLGDFRVYLLVFALVAIAAGRSWTTAVGRAAAWTLLVPVLAYAGNAGVQFLATDLDPNSIWLIYEVLFTGVALLLRERLLSPAVRLDLMVRAYLSSVLLYAVIYYALWAAADVLIQLWQLDEGWALRMLPNQLYYAFWAPYVFFRFVRWPRS